MAAISNMAAYQDGVYSKMVSGSNIATSMKYNSSNGTTSLTGGNTREISTTPIDHK